MNEVVKPRLIRRWSPTELCWSCHDCTSDIVDIIYSIYGGVAERKETNILQKTVRITCSTYNIRLESEI